MKPFKRILVALDLSNMDDNLISYSLWFAKSVKSEKLYFIYCARELQETSEYISENADEPPRDESIHKQIAEAIQKNKLSESLNFEIIVDQIMPLEGLLYWQGVKKIDLVIVGKKRNSLGSGVISRQLVRNNKCPVLFVPENAQTSIHKMLVPTDFSENSGLALQQGINIQPHFGYPEIICLNVFFAPPNEYGAFETGLHATMRKKEVFEKYQKFTAPFSKTSKSIIPLLVPDNDFKTIEIILETAKEKQADLIIIGAIGHSKLKLLMVGSTAEKMMLSDFRVPLLVFKN